MSDEERTFKVRDRRSFDEDGERRSADETDAAAAESPAPTAPDPTPAPPPADESVRFADFVASLATQAAMLLQGLPDDDGPSGPPDLPSARHLIAVLEMLVDKTSGRRSAEEERLLTGLLYELRMAYVAAARAGAA